MSESKFQSFNQCQSYIGDSLPFLPSSPIFYQTWYLSKILHYHIFKPTVGGFQSEDEDGEAEKPENVHFDSLSLSKCSKSCKFGTWSEVKIFPDWSKGQQQREGPAWVDLNVASQYRGGRVFKNSTQLSPQVVLAKQQTWNRELLVSFTGYWLLKQQVVSGKSFQPDLVK